MAVDPAEGFGGGRGRRRRWLPGHEPAGAAAHRGPVGTDRTLHDHAATARSVNSRPRASSARRTTARSIDPGPRAGHTHSSAGPAHGATARSITPGARACCAISPSGPARGATPRADAPCGTATSTDAPGTADAASSGPGGAVPCAGRRVQPTRERRGSGQAAPRQALRREHRPGEAVQGVDRRSARPARGRAAGRASSRGRVRGHIDAQPVNPVNGRIIPHYRAGTSTYERSRPATEPKDVKRPRDSRLAGRAEAVCIRAAHEHGAGAEADRFDDVGATADAAVHQHFRPAVHRGDDLRQHAQRGRRGIELPSAVIRDDHGRRAAFDRPPGVIPGENALDNDRAGPERTNPR